MTEKQNIMKRLNCIYLDWYPKAWDKIDKGVFKGECRELSQAGEVYQTYSWKYCLGWEEDKESKCS